MTEPGNKRIQNVTVINSGGIQNIIANQLRIKECYCKSPQGSGMLHYKPKDPECYYKSTSQYAVQANWEILAGNFIISVLFEKWGLARKIQKWITLTTIVFGGSQILDFSWKPGPSQSVTAVMLVLITYSNTIFEVLHSGDATTNNLQCIFC